MADSDQVGFFYVQESTRGVTPASPAFKAMRVTTPNVTITERTVESGEQRSDRMTSDYIAVAQDVSADIGVEKSYGNDDDFREAAMCGTWAVKARRAVTAATATTFTVTTGTVFRKGMLVRGVGFALSANNALFGPLASDSSATTVTVSGAAIETPPATAFIKAVGFQCASGDCVAATAPNRITITSASGDFSNCQLVPGEWVRLGGAAGGATAFNTAGCNGWARIATVTATTLTFDIVPTGFGADSGTGKTIRITFGDRLDHGTTRRTFTLQRRFNDIAGGAFETSRGQEIGQMVESLSAQAIATGSFAFMGDTGAITNTQIAGATDTAAPSGDVMNTGTDMGLLCIDGVQVGDTDNSFINTLNLTVDNQLRPRAGLNRYGSVGRGLGRLKIEGSAEIYFESLTLAQKALTNTDTQLAWRVGDASGRGILFDLPAAKIDGSLNVGGPNTDVMLPLTIKARRSPTLGYQLRIQRFDETV